MPEASDSPPGNRLNRQIPWLRVFVEGVVIVGSILLAFGIEAAWDQRGQRLEVRLELQNVAQELARNREQVLFQLDLTERCVAGASAMLEIMESESENRVVDLPDTLVFIGATAVPTLNPSLGALEALIGSGRLASVEDAGVRGRLAGLRQRFDDIVENQIRAVELSDTQVRPAINSSVDTRPINQVGNTLLAEERTPGRALVHRSQVGFPNSLLLRNLLVIRHMLCVVTIPEFRALLADMDQLLNELA